MAVQEVSLVDDQVTKHRTQGHDSGLGTHPEAGEEEGRTKQEFKKDCDIMTIVTRWQRDGQVPPPVVGQAIYGNFFETPQHLEDAVEHFQVAMEEFEALPIEIRDGVDNNPVRYLELMQAAARGEAEAIEDLQDLGVEFPPLEDESTGPASNTDSPAAAPQGTATQETSPSETPPS